MDSWWERRKKEKELEEEVRGHLEMAARERVDRGEDVDSARAMARREFGGVELVKETARETWGWEWLHRVWLDVRFGARALMKSPGFSAVVVATLALGIGANTAIFSLIHQLLLAPLPYKDSANIVNVFSTNEAFKGFHLGVSLGDAAEMKNAVPSLTETTIYDWAGKSLTGETKPQNVETVQVTNNFFEFFGTTPQMGRFFVDEEHRPSYETVAVISDALWRTRFGSDPRILGKRIRLDGKDYTVVGVTRAAFDFPSRTIAVWLPLAPTLEESQDHNSHSHEMAARLRKGATLEQADNELMALSERIEK